MDHLSETQLNEYLDGLMEASAQPAIEAHLSECAVCRVRLADLQSVFLALAALPETPPERDLTPLILKNLPEHVFGLAWRLAFAVQAGMSLGLLLLIFPWLTGRLDGLLPEWIGEIHLTELKVPYPGQFHFSSPALHFPAVPILALPIPITPNNLPIWLILGVAAALLFVVGNFSLIFHSTPGARK